VKQRHREQALVLFGLVHDDLGKHQSGHILAAGGILNLDPMTGLDQFGDIIDSYITTQLTVVESTVGIFFDEDSVFHSSFLFYRVTTSPSPIRYQTGYKPPFL
jgi:hypothetical protein